VEHHKLIQPTGALRDYDELVPFVRNLEKPSVIAWGAANRDIDREGLTMRVRAPGETSERTFVAPLGELADTLIDWLVGRGLCARVQPPAWYRAPTGDQLALYAVLLHNLQLQILADEKNKALLPLRADLQDDMVDYALDGVKELSTGGDQIKIAALTTALY